MQPVLPKRIKPSILLFFFLILPGMTAQSLPADAFTGKDILQYKDNSNTHIVFHGKTIDCYGLTIKVDSHATTKLRAPDRTKFSIYYNNKLIRKADDIEVAEHFPRPELTTIMTTYFSGGASCCFDYTMFTINEAAPSILMTTLDSGGREACDENGFFQKNGTIKSCQWDFTGYYTESGNHSIQMFPGIAFCLDRYLVFENNQWRLDRVGEFKSAYVPKLDEIAKGAAATVETDDPAGIQAAYYSIMSGENASNTKTRMRGFVADALVSNIFADVTKDIQRTDVLQNHWLDKAGNAGPRQAPPSAANTLGAQQPGTPAPRSGTATDNRSGMHGVIGHWKGEFRLTNPNGKHYTVSYDYTVMPNPNTPDRLTFRQLDTLRFDNPLDVFSCSGKNTHTVIYDGEITAANGTLRFMQQRSSNPSCGTPETDTYAWNGTSIEAVRVDGGKITAGALHRIP